MRNSGKRSPSGSTTSVFEKRPSKFKLNEKMGVLKSMSLDDVSKTTTTTSSVLVKQVDIQKEEDSTSTTPVSTFSLLTSEISRNLVVCISGYGAVSSRPSGNGDKTLIMNMKQISSFMTYRITVNSTCESHTNGTKIAKWDVYRRYSAFLTLLYRVCKVSQTFGDKLGPLPRKANDKVSNTEIFLKQRARGLNEWLDNAVFSWRNDPTVHQEIGILFTNFLSEDANVCPLDNDECFISYQPPIVEKENNRDNSNKLEQKTENVEIQTETRKKPSLEEFSFLKVIGKGSFGQVFLAKCNNSKEKQQEEEKQQQQQAVAIKVLGKAEMVRRKQSIRVETERWCMDSLICPFIAKLHSSFQTETHLYLVQPFFPGGEMFFHLEQQGKFSNKLARFYAAECALALSHLHRNGVIYRDLKPENIMIDCDGHIKLIDFGLAKRNVFHSNRGAVSFVGTTEYLSPEMILKQGHGYALDYWSLGMVLYEMLTGLPPWYREEKKKLLRDIVHTPLTFPAQEVCHNARNLLRSLLCKDPNKRLGSASGIYELRNHPYFKPIDFFKLYEKRIKPPFVPRLQSKIDTCCFSTSFTSLPVYVPCLDKKIKPEGDDVIVIRNAERNGIFDKF